MINAKQFRSLIVKPVLQALDFWSQEAENLLVMIMSWESNGGSYLAQVKGPAKGAYMMEFATHQDLWFEVLYPKDGKHHHLIDEICRWCNFKIAPEANEMIRNLDYATIMARIFFLRIKEPIPTGLHELAAYAKKYWNTEKGKATPDDYYQAYCRLEGISS